MENPQFSHSLEVRDYECDLQGIVNNANYQHYLEHARHKFLHSQGFDFAELTARGMLLIVIRIEIDFKYPLRSGDKFSVQLRLERISPIRFAFQQEIIREDGKPIIKAKVVTAAMNEKGRPIVPKELESLIPTEM